MTRDRKRPFTKIKADAEKAADEWIENHMPNVRHTVHTLLDRQLEHAILKVMGFTKSFNEWEISHDSRLRDSPARKFIEDLFDNPQTHEHVIEWLTKMIGDLPDLSKQARKALQKLYSDQLYYKLQDLIDNAAQDQAEKMLNDIINAPGKEFQEAPKEEEV